MRTMNDNPSAARNKIRIAVVITYKSLKCVKSITKQKTFKKTLDRCRIGY